MTEDTSLERSLQLLDAVYDRTVEGSLEWGETGHAGAFSTSVSGWGVWIREIPDPELPDQPDYALEVREGLTNRLIEHISNVTLRPLLDRQREGRLHPYSALKEIFTRARRKALRVDESIESILEALTKK